MSAKTCSRVLRAEALEHLLKEDVAVVLIDLDMPEIEGFSSPR